MMARANRPQSVAAIQYLSLQHRSLPSLLTPECHSRRRIRRRSRVAIVRRGCYRVESIVMDAGIAANSPAASLALASNSGINVGANTNRIVGTSARSE